MISLISATISLAMAAPKMDQIKSDSWKRPIVVSHRGAGSYSKENTLPAFKAAIKAGALVTECDVHISADGVPMVIHDVSLNRTTPLKGLVSETKSQEMVHAGVPTLAQVCEVTRGKIILAVEIKSDKTEQAVVDTLNKYGMAGQSMIMSFGEDILAEVRKAGPQFYTVLLISGPVEDASYVSLNERLTDLKVNAVGFNYTYLKPELVKSIQSKKREVFCWTVPPGRAVENLTAMKVNFIITNSPNEVAAQLKRR